MSLWFDQEYALEPCICIPNGRVCIMVADIFYTGGFQCRVSPRWSQPISQ